MKNPRSTPHHHVAPLLLLCLMIAAPAHVLAENPAVEKLQTQIEAGNNTALTKLKKLAEKGDVDAQYALGKIYSSGTQKIEANPNEAASWLSKAAMYGSEQSLIDLVELFAQFSGSITKERRNEIFYTMAFAGQKYPEYRKKANINYHDYDIMVQLLRDSPMAYDPCSIADNATKKKIQLLLNESTEVYLIHLIPTNDFPTVNFKYIITGNIANKINQCNVQPTTRDFEIYDYLVSAHPLDKGIAEEAKAFKARHNAPETASQTQVAQRPQTYTPPASTYEEPEPVDDELAVGLGAMAGILASAVIASKTGGTYVPPSTYTSSSSRTPGGGIDTGTPYDNSRYSGNNTNANNSSQRSGQNTGSTDDDGQAYAAKMRSPSADPDCIRLEEEGKVRVYAQVWRNVCNKRISVHGICYPPPKNRQGQSLQGNV